MTQVPETPVQIKDCIIAECKKAPKGFRTARGLKGHMKKFHDVVIDALSPVAATARVLFDGGMETASTQGNSRGQINFPRVVSDGVHQCGKCPEQFRNRDEVKNHMDKEHDNSKAAEPCDKRANSDESNLDGDYDDALNDDKDEEDELNNVMEDIEDSDIAKGLENRAAANKIVETFVEIAFREMHPAEVVSNPTCHECECKDENLVKLDKLLSEKDAKIEEKSATIRGLMETMRKNVKTRAVMQKKIDQGDKVKRKLGEKQKENARLRVIVETKEALVEVQPETVQLDAEKHADQDIIVDVVLKKCKKCKFTAPNMNVLGLHMENDHQYQFECSECNKKFPFKNQLKIHMREMHEEGTFSCFVCNNRFKTHKELKQHIQKKCKTQVTGSQSAIVHKHNEDILEEDEHRCPKCPKITNNQVSLINHMNTKHSATKNKCDSCGQEFESKEVLITHIVENHTNKGTQIVQRHVCKVCNVEVHGDEARNNHACRKPQNKCSFCKANFYSQEAQRNHICGQHHYKTVDEQMRAQKRKNIECTHGVDCYRARLGKCWFRHSQQVNTFPHRGQVQGPTVGQGQGSEQQQGQGQGQVQQQIQGQEHGQGWQQHRRQGRGWQQGGQKGGQQGGRQGQGQGADLAGRPPLYCKYQERCFKIQTCKFKHLAQVFPQENQGQNVQL